MLIHKQYNRLILLERDRNTTMVFIIEVVKETVLDFSQGTVKVLWICFTLIYISTKWLNATL